MFAFGRYFTIPQMLDNFQYLGPRRKRPIVDPLVFVNGHDERELLLVHLAFFGAAALVTSTAARAPPAFHAAATVHDAASTIHSGAAIWRLPTVRA